MNETEKMYLKEEMRLPAPLGYEGRGRIWKTEPNEWSISWRRQGEDGWVSCGQIDSRLLPSFIIDAARKKIENSIKQVVGGQATTHTDLMEDIRKWGSE